MPWYSKQPSIPFTASSWIQRERESTDRDRDRDRPAEHGVVAITTTRIPIENNPLSAEREGRLCEHFSRAAAPQQLGDSLLQVALVYRLFRWFRFFFPCFHTYTCSFTYTFTFTPKFIHTYIYSCINTFDNWIPSLSFPFSSFSVLMDFWCLLLFISLRRRSISFFLSARSCSGVRVLLPALGSPSAALSANWTNPASNLPPENKKKHITTEGWESY